MEHTPESRNQDSTMLFPYTCTSSSVGAEDKEETVDWSKRPGLHTTYCWKLGWIQGSQYSTSLPSGYCYWQWHPPPTPTLLFCNQNPTWRSGQAKPGNERKKKKDGGGDWKHSSKKERKTERRQHTGFWIYFKTMRFRKKCSHLPSQHPWPYAN